MRVMTSKVRHRAKKFLAEFLSVGTIVFCGLFVQNIFATKFTQSGGAQETQSHLDDAPLEVMYDLPDDCAVQAPASSCWDITVDEKEYIVGEINAGADVVITVDKDLVPDGWEWNGIGNESDIKFENIDSTAIAKDITDDVITLSFTMPEDVPDDGKSIIVKVPIKPTKYTVIVEYEAPSGLTAPVYAEKIKVGSAETSYAAAGVSVDYGATVKVPIPIQEGWVSNGDVTVTGVSANIGTGEVDFTMPVGGVTVKIPVTKKYTVIYCDSSGNPYITPAAIVRQFTGETGKDEITVDTNGPTIGGTQYFDGWYTSLSGGTKVTGTLDLSDAETRNMFELDTSSGVYTLKLYAVLGEKYKVTYNAGGKTLSSDSAKLPDDAWYTPGTSDIAVSDVELKSEGHTFMGWQEDEPANANKVIISDGKFTMPARNVVFEAQWKETEYKVIVEYEAPSGLTAPVYDEKIKVGSAGTEKPYAAAGVSVDYGATVKVPIPIKEGWVSNGEVTVADENGDVIAQVSAGKGEVDFTMPPDDVVITVPVTKEYTVEFNNNYQNAKQEVHKKVTNIVHGTAWNIAVGDDVGKPMRTGYTFEGWGTTTDATKAVTFPDEVTKDLKYYAIWEPIKYDIVYKANGGSGDDYKVLQVPFDKLKDHKLTTVEKAGFKNDGFEFVGWALSTASTTILTPEHKLDDFGNWVDYIVEGTEEIVVYARWEKDPKYTVTFCLNYGASDTREHKKYEDIDKGTAWNTAVGEVPDPDYRSGYTFIGWGKNRDSQDKVIFPSTVTQNLDYYAIWEEKKLDAPPQDNKYDVTVKFTAPDGVTVPDDKKLREYVKDATVNETIEVPTGYILDTGGGKKITVTDDVATIGDDLKVNFTMPAKNVVITVPVTKKYTVSYELAGGSTPAGIRYGESVVHGEKAAKPVNPIPPEGKEFLYWALRGQTAEYDFDLPVTKDIVLRAKYNTIGNSDVDPPFGDSVTYGDSHTDDDFIFVETIQDQVNDKPDEIEILVRHSYYHVDNGVVVAHDDLVKVTVPVTYDGDVAKIAVQDIVDQTCADCNDQIHFKDYRCSFDRNNDGYISDDLIRQLAVDAQDGELSMGMLIVDMEYYLYSNDDIKYYQVVHNYSDHQSNTKYTVTEEQQSLADKNKDGVVNKDDINISDYVNTNFKGKEYSYKTYHLSYDEDKKLFMITLDYELLGSEKPVVDNVDIDNISEKPVDTGKSLGFEKQAMLIVLLLSVWFVGKKTQRD